MFRVFLALLGTLFMIVAALGYSRGISGLGWLGWLLVIIFVALGASAMCASFFSSDKNAEKWSEAASTHVATVILVLAAFPVAWVIGKVFPRDGT